MTSQWGCTALMQTAFRGHVAALDELLDRGGDIEAKDLVSLWGCRSWAMKAIRSTPLGQANRGFVCPVRAF